MQNIEDYESSLLVGDGRKLGESICKLSVSSDERDLALARKLDLHYRNANVRIVFNEYFLNRTIPEQNRSASTYNEVTTGTDQGRSTTWNDVKIVGAG